MERYVIVIPADEEQKARLVRCDDGDPQQRVQQHRRRPEDRQRAEPLTA